MSTEPIGAGGNSFNDIDSQKLFQELDLKKNTIFLDLACGFGDYSLEAAHHIGNEGKIYALDLWDEGIENLKDKIQKQELNNIEAQLTDVSQELPLENDSIDVILISTVLHDFVEDNTYKKVLQQVKRVLKSDGKLAILEFKKEETSHGPPNEVRLLPEDVENMLLPYSFKKEKYVDMGKSHYLMIFKAP